MSWREDHNDFIVRQAFREYRAQQEEIHYQKTINALQTSGIWFIFITLVVITLILLFKKKK